jgi:hypothetical protein
MLEAQNPQQLIGAKRRVRRGYAEDGTGQLEVLGDRQCVEECEILG